MSSAYELAKAEVGVVEWAKGSNPKVVAYFKDAGHPEVRDDATAWCAAFVGAMLARSGVKPTGKLTARSYLQFGEMVDTADARPGDIVVRERGGSAWQGHVFFFDKWKVPGKVMIGLGGNQRDSVNRQEFPMEGTLGIRRAPTKAPAKPAAPPKPAPVTPPAGPFAAIFAGLVAAVAALLKWAGVW